MHPNKTPFIGILAPLDTPSDKSPSGARGHKVVLCRKAASAAISSLIGMGINVSKDWSGHNAKAKIGVIEHAEISGNAIVISGFIWKRDFPEVIERIAACSED